MNREFVRTLLWGCVLSLAASSAFAQNPNIDPARTPASSPTGKETAPSSAASSTQSVTSLRLAQIIGSSVLSTQGKPLGTIRDLTVDPQAGRLEFAILSLNFGGGGPSTATISAATVGQLTPVPWQILAPAAPGVTAATNASPAVRGTPAGIVTRSFIFNGDESVLQRAQSFDVNRLNDLEKSEVNQSIFSHFGVDRNGGFMGTGIGTGVAPGTSDSAGTGINKGTAPGTRPIPGSPGTGVNTPTTPRKDGGGGAGSGRGTGR